MNRVCVVVPTYEEADNLPELVDEVEEVIQGEDFALIVVDDNSPDGTADVADGMNKRYGNIVVHRRPGKLGIGSAIRDGIKIALSFPDCERIVTMDADLSHHPRDLPSLLKEAEKTDLVQGSRYVKGGRITGWSFSRRTVSYAANLFCRLLLRTGLHEHTTYFRVYSRKCAEIVSRNVHCNRFEWAIDSILVVKAYGLRTREVPILFSQRNRGKSKLEMFDLFKWGAHLVGRFLRRPLAGTGECFVPPTSPVTDQESVASVSVGVCAYNEETNIGNLLSGLLNQTTSDFDLSEIIVVASGCTDRTEEIVRDYQGIDTRIRLFRENVRNGKASAVNLVLREAKGQVIVMESADTMPNINCIDRLVRPFRDPNVAGAGARPIPVNNDASIADCASRLVWQYLHHELSSRKVRLSGEMFAIRAGIVKEIPSEIVLDDVYIQHSIEKQKRKLVYVPDAIVFMKGPGTISDLIKQRRKNIVGFLQLRKYTGVVEPTMSPVETFSLLVKALPKIRGLRFFVVVPLAALCEAFAHLLSKHDISAGVVPVGGTWSTVSSTKNLIKPIRSSSGEKT